jgi:hypothetical protein
MEGTMRISIGMILFIGLFIPFASNTFAQIYTIESNGEYVMGDSDTKIEARKLALEHAKRLALEQIGTYLDSETVVKNGYLTRDEIKTYTSGIIQTTVISEDMSFLQNKTVVFKIRIKAKVDTALLEKKIREINADTKRKAQIHALQAKHIRLLKEVESLSGQLKSDNVVDYRRLRQRRENLLEKLEKNQKSLKVAFEKGTLLNLAIKNKGEIGEQKTYIDDFFQFISDNIVFTIGDPRVRHKGDRADLLMDVHWRIDKLDDVRKRLLLFYEEDSIGYVIMIREHGFKGINGKVLNDYCEQKAIRLNVEVGKWQVFSDIKRKGHNIMFTRKSETLIIGDVPLTDLSDITSIDANIIIN